jgi:hypothetical protein
LAAPQGINQLLFKRFTLIIQEMDVQRHAVRFHFEAVKAPIDLHASRGFIALDAVAIGEHNREGFRRSLVGAAGL